MLAQESRFRGFQFRGELGRNGCGSLGTGEEEWTQAEVPGLGKEKGGPATAKGSSARDPAVWDTYIRTSKTKHEREESKNQGPEEEDDH